MIKFTCIQIAFRLIAQTALENPSGYSYHVNYRRARGHFFFTRISVGDVRREYFAGDARTIDARGLIGLSTFRFVCASRLETGCSSLNCSSIRMQLCWNGST